MGEHYNSFSQVSSKYSNELKLKYNLYIYFLNHNNGKKLKVIGKVLDDNIKSSKESNQPVHICILLIKKYIYNLILSFQFCKYIFQFSLLCF